MINANAHTHDVISIWCNDNAFQLDLCVYVCVTILKAILLFSFFYVL